MRALTREEIAREHELDREAAEHMLVASLNHERQGTVLNQARLHGGKVLLGGEGPAAELVLAGLAGLGIDTVNLLDERHYRSAQRGPMSIPREGMTVAESMVATAHELYEDGKYAAIIPGRLEGIEHPDCVIETGVEDGLRRFASENEIPYISVSGGGREVMVTDTNASGREPSFLTGGISGAVALDWVKRILAPDKADLVMEPGEKFYHSLRGKPEDGRAGTRYFPSRPKLDDKRVLIVGAGAIGTYVALQAAAAGFGGLDIIDNDVIEQHNLNRQVLYHGKVGEPKATTLLERVRSFSRVEGEAQERWLDAENIDAIVDGYDAVFSCLDKKAPRRLLNDHATAHGYLLVDGGTDAFSGQVAAYSPGKQDCIACRRDISGEDLQSQSCADRAEPSVIIPNMMVGSLMIAEAIHALANDRADPKVLMYDSRECKLYENPVTIENPGCGCGGGSR